MEVPVKQEVCDELQNNLQSVIGIQQYPEQCIKHEKPIEFVLVLPRPDFVELKIENENLEILDIEKLKCCFCGKAFKNKRDVVRHEKTVHGES